MNSTLVQSATRVHTQSSPGVDLFGCTVNPGTSYMPETLHLDPSGYTLSDDDHTIAYSFNISDSAIYAFNNLTFSFEVPELLSEKQIAYTTHFGFKLIKKVEIFDDVEKLVEIDGQTLFSRAFVKRKDLGSSGYGRDLNDFNLSTLENLNDAKRYYLPAKKINVPLELFDDTLETFSNIKNGVNSRLKIVIFVHNNLQDVMVYNPGAILRYTYDRVVEGMLGIKKPVLTSVVYTTQQKSLTTSQYTIFNKEVRGKTNEDEHFVFDVDNLTHVNFAVGNNLSGKTFLCWAGYDQSEENWIRTYLKKLLEDCVIVLPDGKTPEDLDIYPEKAQFVQVVDNQIDLSGIKTIDIWVERVPKTCKVWMHLNPLVFRANKTKGTYNVIEQINKIHLCWNSTRNNFTILDVDHQISIGDISIPLSIWNVQTKSKEGDTRSTLSKETDVVINDPFLRGIDFLNKQNPIEAITLKHGNETIYQSTLDTIYYFPDQACRIRFPFQSKGYGNVSFSYHHDMGVSPNYLPSDHLRGKNQIGLKVHWTKYDEQDPRYHICKTLLLQYGTLGNIEMVEGKNKTTIVNARV